MQRDCPHLVEDAAAATSLGMLHLTNWGRSNHKELYFDGDSTRFVTKDVACHFRIKRAYFLRPYTDYIFLFWFSTVLVWIQTTTVLNQNKKILKLWDRSRQLSQAEKKNDCYVTFWQFLNFTKWQLHMYLHSKWFWVQNIVLLSENSCHFVNLINFANSLTTQESQTKCRPPMS